MAQEFVCPHCGQTIEVEAQYLGMELKCPLCQGAFNTPAEGAAVEPPPVATPPPLPSARVPTYTSRRSAGHLNPYQPGPGAGYLRSHRGSTILVLGILGLLVFPPIGLFAWSMGNTDLKAMRAGRMDRSGEQMTKAGRVLGIVSFFLLGWLILWLFILLSMH